MWQLSDNALKSIDRLLDKIADNPTLFFGMEDTCQDEFDEARKAVDEATPAMVAPRRASETMVAKLTARGEAA